MNIASKANIFGAATVGLRSSAEEDCPAVGSTNVTCFFLLSALKKLPPSPGDTFSITFTCNQKDEKTLIEEAEETERERNVVEFIIKRIVDPSIPEETEQRAIRPE